MRRTPLARRTPLRRVEFGAQTKRPRDGGTSGGMAPNTGGSMQDQPNGLCGCGCGRATSIVDRSNASLGLVKGEYRRYLKGHHPLPPGDLTRYEVDAATGCWVWQGALTAQGYGAARFDRRYAAAHRAVWLASGREIPGSMHLHHECRNRACVNPEHLTLVSGREHARLHARENATLTRADARAIRERAAETGENANEIAPDYEVTRSAITAVLRGDLWPDAGGPLRRRVPYTQLSAHDVSEIKRRASEGEKHRDLGREFGVSNGRISKLISGKTYKRRQRMISPASSAQREKTRAAASIVSGEHGCDPAHIWPRGMGGCDDALCVVPLTRLEHSLYDEGKLDLLPHLLAHRCVDELAHALVHARGDLIGLLNLLTGERWAPEPKTNERER